VADVMCSYSCNMVVHGELMYEMGCVSESMDCRRPDAF
jgi:hypothetical protein